MKKFGKKGVLLFAAAMALCAFAMPTAAGALSWDPLGTNQTITSPNVGFTSTPAGIGTVVSSCTNSTFNVTVAGAASSTLEVTGATFGGTCTAVVAGVATCTTTATGTGFPWTITALATNNVRLDNLNIDVKFDQSPLGTCPATLIGQSLLITGSTNSGGSWNATTDELILSDAEGLSSHGPTGTSAITARGTFTDLTAPRVDLTD